MKWQQTDKPLPDGWYWRKCSLDDPDPECIEVCNGVMVDKRPMDSHGAHIEVYEHDEFKGWWWCGPLSDSGCCCKFSEDGETILELCAAHKLHLDIQLEEQRYSLLAETIDAIKIALNGLEP